MADSKIKQKMKRLASLQQCLRHRLKMEKVQDPKATEILKVVLDSVVQTSPVSKCKRRVYLSNLFKVLEDAIERCSLIEPRSDYSLHQVINDVLILQNFNLREFYSMCTKNISLKLSILQTVEEKVDLLYFERKTIKQIQLERDLCYDDRLPTIQTMLEGWISEEIAYLERKLVMERGSYLNGSEGISPHTVSGFKVQLDMSVAQLTCLVRALMDQKLILNTNLTELSTFFARSVVTKRSETMSEGSFRRKYYNIEESTRRSVAEILKGTIHWVSRQQASHEKIQ